MQLVDIKIIFAKVPDGYSGSITLSINGLEEVTELALQTAGTQLPDQIKQSAIHLVKRLLMRGEIICRRGEDKVFSETTSKSCR